MLAAEQVRVEDQCSWKLDSSTARTSYAGTASTASINGSPTLPAATVDLPAAARIEASRPTVVVFPSVPVPPTQSPAPAGRSRQASSGSPMTSTPAAAAAASSG